MPLYYVCAHLPDVTIIIDIYYYYYFHFILSISGSERAVHNQLAGRARLDIGLYFYQKKREAGSGGGSVGRRNDQDLVARRFGEEGKVGWVV